MKIPSIFGALAAGALLAWSPAAPAASVPQRLMAEAHKFRDCLDPKNQDPAHCTRQRLAAKKGICETECSRLACAKQRALANVCVAMCPRNEITQCAKAAGINTSETSVKALTERMGEDEFCAAYIFGLQYRVGERFNCSAW